MEMSPTSARLLAGVLEQRTGQQLAPSRSWRLDMALDPIVRDRGFESADAIAAAVAGGRDPRLSDEVVEALLNNETSFFRDSAAFRQLDAVIATEVAATKGWAEPIRIWSAGCSTGQEAYSLAILLAEDARLAGRVIDIVATDVSHAAIGRARAGVYSQIEIQRGLPARQMIRWFTPVGHKDDWQATSALRTKVRFHVLNLLDPPPLPGRFDLILCRNVLLYFAAGARRAAFARLAAACAPGGLLMLGAGETVMAQSDHFAPDAVHRGLYRKTQA